MIIFTGLALALAAPAVADMTASGYFEEGNRLYRDDLYWAALLRYRQAREAGLDTPILHYNEGVAHYHAGQYDRAAESLAEALESPQLRTTAHYNLGLNAWAAGDTEAALRWFRLARDQQQDEKIAEYARVAIARLSADDRADVTEAVAKYERRRKRPFGDLDLRATLGYGTDNNVFRTPGNNYRDLSDPALPVVVPVEQSGEYVDYRLNARYNINSYPYEGFFGAYRVAGRYYPDEALENANEFSHELAVGSEYRRRDEESGRYRRVYSAFEIAQHNEVYFDPDDGESRIVDDFLLDDRLNYLRYGPEIRLRQSGRQLTLGFEATGQLWNYESTEASPEYDHEYFNFVLYTQYRFTSSSLIRLTARKFSRRFGDRRSRNRDGSIDVDNALLRYDYFEAGLRARQEITNRLWFGVEYERRERTDRYVGYNDYIRDSYGFELNWNIGSRFEVELSGFYRLYNYENAFAFNVPFGGDKTLEIADFELDARYRLTRHLSILLAADYRDTASTDTRIEYDRTMITLGVRWQQ